MQFLNSIANRYALPCTHIQQNSFFWNYSIPHSHKYIDTHPSIHTYICMFINVSLHYHNIFSSTYNYISPAVSRTYQYVAFSARSWKVLGRIYYQIIWLYNFCKLPDSHSDNSSRCPEHGLQYPMTKVYRLKIIKMQNGVNKKWIPNFST